MRFDIWCKHTKGADNPLLFGNTSSHSRDVKCIDGHFAKLHAILKFKNPTFHLMVDELRTLGKLVNSPYFGQACIDAQRTARRWAADFESGRLSRPIQEITEPCPLVRRGWELVHDLFELHVVKDGEWTKMRTPHHPTPIATCRSTPARLPPPTFARFFGNAGAVDGVEVWVISPAIAKSTTFKLYLAIENQQLSRAELSATIRRLCSLDALPMLARYSDRSFYGECAVCAAQNSVKVAALVHPLVVQFLPVWSAVNLECMDPIHRLRFKQICRTAIGDAAASALFVKRAKRKSPPTRSRSAVPSKRSRTQCSVIVID